MISCVKILHLIRCDLLSKIHKIGSYLPLISSYDVLTSESKTHNIYVPDGLLPITGVTTLRVDFI